VATALLGACHTPAAVLLAAQACDSGFALLVSQSLAGDLEIEAQRWSQRKMV
jgi:hypothetical protein